MKQCSERCEPGRVSWFELWTGIISGVLAAQASDGDVVMRLAAMFSSHVWLLRRRKARKREGVEPVRGERSETFKRF